MGVGGWCREGVDMSVGVGGGEGAEVGGRAGVMAEGLAEVRECVFVGGRGDVELELFYGLGAGGAAV